MKRHFISTALLAIGLAAAIPAIADHDDDSHSSNGFTLAVYGDSPYGCKAPTAAVR